MDCDRGVGKARHTLHVLFSHADVIFVKNQNLRFSQSQHVAGSLAEIMSGLKLSDSDTFENSYTEATTVHITVWMFGYPHHRGDPDATGQLAKVESSGVFCCIVSQALIQPLQSLPVVCLWQSLPRNTFSTNSFPRPVFLEGPQGFARFLVGTPSIQGAR